MLSSYSELMAQRILAIKACVLPPPDSTTVLQFHFYSAKSFIQAAGSRMASIHSATPPAFTKSNQKCTIDLLVKDMMVVSLICFLYCLKEV